MAGISLGRKNGRERRKNPERRSAGTAQIFKNGSCRWCDRPGGGIADVGEAGACPGAVSRRHDDLVPDDDDYYTMIILTMTITMIITIILTIIIP